MWQKPCGKPLVTKESFPRFTGRSDFKPVFFTAWQARFPILSPALSIAALPAHTNNGTRHDEHLAGRNAASQRFQSGTPAPIAAGSAGECAQGRAWIP